MKHGWTTRRAIGSLLCFLFLWGALSPVSFAAGQPRKTVRVGFFAFDGYHMRDSGDTPSGYGYELLQRMVGYTDWKLEYVGYDSNWSDMQAMLAAGEIDLVTSAQKTDERVARFAFSDEPIGTSSAILTVKVGNYDYMQNDYANWSGMRVGMLRDNSRNDRFAAYAQEHGFSYQPVYFDSVDEMVSQLKTGDSIDAILTSNLRSIQDEWVLVQFDPSPFYIMLRQDDPELLADVNRALASLFAIEPEIRARLANKFYAPKSGAEIAYTLEERAYIRSLADKPLVAILNPDRAPYSFLTQEGKPCGILHEIALLIIERTGLPIAFADVANRVDYGRRVNAGAYDIRFDASFDYARADELDYRLTASYLDAPISRLYRHDHTGAFRSVALLESGDISNLYRNALIDDTAVVSYYENTDAVVEAVITGKQDVTYLYRGVADLAVQKEPTNALIAEELYGYATNFAVAVNADLDPLLYSILSKAVASLNQTEFAEIAQRYSAYAQQPFSLIGYAYDYPLHVLVAAFALFLVTGLVVTILSLSRRRKREAERLAQESLRADQLAQALDAARQADNAKNLFLSSMSHEIRTPLNAVIGYNTIARNDLTSAKTAEERRQADMRIMDSLHKSEIASKHLLNIINDVLDMSAIENGKLQVAREPFDFKSMINSLTSLFFAQARAKGIGLEVLLDKPIEEWFVGDQMRINQALTNLLSNAVKFTPEQGIVKLAITQLLCDDRTARLRFVVSDSGIGMSKEYLERIWKPFEQADASISRRFGGTGLGLSITKSLVDLMGGSIHVESEAGVGTTFTLELTLERMAQPVRSASYAFSDIHALVIDNDESTCDYIRILFDRCGARCATVTSGIKAVTMFDEAKQKGDPYNVCLVDWRMPRMDGLETVREIRKIAGGEIPIIIVTAYDFTEIAEDAENAGVNMFISKPLFQSSLFDLLANISGEQSPKKLDRSLKFDFSGARVLLAEDNKMNMEIARRILASVGLAVDSVWNGQDAIDAFVNAPNGTYAAILMDVHMPEVDGYQATRSIRACSHPDAKTIPIIAMTADAFAEDIVKACESGMNDHVSKPIDIHTLFVTLQKYIASHI